jgi:hypothetical protein
MQVIQRAIGQHMAFDTPLSEAIAEVCEEEQIEPEEIGAWIHDFKGLLQTIELNAKKHRLLNDTDEPLTTSLSDLFE